MQEFVQPEDVPELTYQTARIIPQLNSAFSALMAGWAGWLAGCAGWAGFCMRRSLSAAIAESPWNIVRSMHIIFLVFTWVITLNQLALELCSFQSRLSLTWCFFTQSLVEWFPAQQQKKYRCILRAYLEIRWGHFDQCKVARNWLFKVSHPQYQSMWILDLWSKILDTEINLTSLHWKQKEILKRLGYLESVSLCRGPQPTKI